MEYHSWEGRIMNQSTAIFFISIIFSGLFVLVTKAPFVVFGGVLFLALSWLLYIYARRKFLYRGMGKPAFPTYKHRYKPNHDVGYLIGLYGKPFSILDSRDQEMVEFFMGEGKSYGIELVTSDHYPFIHLDIYGKSIFINRKYSDDMEGKLYLRFDRLNLYGK